MKKIKFFSIFCVIIILSSIFGFSENKSEEINHHNPIKVTVKQKITLPTREFTLFAENGQKVPFIINVLDNKNYVIVPLQKVNKLKLQTKNPNNIISISEYMGEVFVQTKSNFYRLKELNNNLYSNGEIYFSPKNYKSTMDYTTAAPAPASTDYTNVESVSETNVQVKGVDEADIIKVSGNNIFYSKDNNINIVTVNNGKFVGQSLLKLDEDFTLYDMYVDKARLVAIGSNYKNNRTYTQAITYDISNLNSPKIYRTVSQEGIYFSSRKINDDVYLISETRLRYGFNVPKYMDSAVSSDYKEIDLTKLRFFPPYNPGSIATVSNFSTTDKNPAIFTNFLGYADHIYMNRDNLYISYVDYDYDYIIPTLYNQENSSPSTDTKEIIEPDYNYMPKTVIKKFSIKNNTFNYISEAKVFGTLINQFAMDENNGYFRVAYTKDLATGSEVAVFDKNMKQVGLLEKIAPTERIYSARFMNDRLYLVTFKETDPFFVIDLKNPSNPNVLGYLKIPGYSDYLHPYDNNHIIGFGNATQETQYGNIITSGMKIAMFDVTDVKNPKQISNVEIGNYETYSEIMYNHKSLMYNAQQNYFGFPVQVSEKRKNATSAWDVEIVFQGGFIYEITPDFKFKLKGKTTHKNNMNKNNSEYDSHSNLYDINSDIRRLVYIGDYIYSISDRYVSSNKASDMSFIQKIEWAYRNNPYK